MKAETKKLIQSVIDHAQSQNFSADHADWVAEQLKYALAVERNK